MKQLLTLLLVVTVLSAHAQKTVLINNVQIFNGVDNKTILGNLLIVDNRISKISSKPIPVNKSANTSIIDGKGKFLMPGLIDAHTHLVLESLPKLALLTSDVPFLSIVAAKSAEANLMQGYTTFRDLAGPSFGIKKAIDMGIIKGPRIYPSGAMISQTSGHGDFLMPQDVPRDAAAPLSFAEKNNVGIIADGVDEVLKRVREQLRLGATQIKLAAGGGAASDFDPLDASQYTEAELAAAVAAAENWNTYVTVHAYTPDAIKTSIKAGVKCIEHGQLADEASVKLMAEKKVWWCLQPFLEDSKERYAEGSANRAKMSTIVTGTDSAYFFAKKYNVNVAFGTDALFDASRSGNRSKILSQLLRWYTPFEILNMATAKNGKLMALSGARNPYPHKLGVIEEGAYADLLIVDGNALQNIQLLENPQQNLLLIMKDGVVYKNSLKP